jgi:hypothetical protein
LPQWVESIKEEIAKEPELQKLVKLINQREAWSKAMEGYYSRISQGFP